MTFTFPRISAGIYEVQKDSNTVGFIRKVNTTKWMVVDVVDTPQHVTKTLKEAKSACIDLIIFDNSNTEDKGVDNTQESEYDTFAEVDETVVNTNLKGSLNTYRQVPGTDKFEKVSVTEFGFAEPTLDPIAF